MASDGFSINLKGDRELRRVLDRAGPKAAKSSLRAGIRAMARVIIKDARRRLAGRYRVVRKSLNVRVHRPERGGRKITATVGPTVGRGTRFNAWYAHIVERGAAAHDIGVSTKRVLVEATGGGRSGGTSFGQVLGTLAKHGGVAARPFLGPAFRAQASEAIRAAGTKIWETLRKRMGR